MKRLQFSGIPTQNREEFYQVDPSASEPTGNYYFLSNDQLTLKLDKRKGSGDTVICGVANPHFLHVIGMVTAGAPPKRIIAVDYNYDQLLHFKRIHDLILVSSNRIEYLQRLFKVTFNARAIRVLQELRPSPENFVRGGVVQDQLFRLEQEVWQNLSFDEEAFHAAYGFTGSLGKGGLVIESSTVGDINTYYATFFCCSRSDYEHWPFTAGFGSGFLRDEKSFTSLQQTLKSTPLYLIQADLAAVYPDLMQSNRYHPLVVWCSNLLCDYFVEKHPKIAGILELSLTLGLQEEPDFPEVDLVLLQDERTQRELPAPIDNRRRHLRNWSIHTRSFAVVSRYLRGADNLEVIAVPRWYEQDHGVSKLPNTSYLMVEDFETVAGTARYDSIFLHILRGHGVSAEAYAGILKKARAMTDNLIILEHNRSSRDFRKLAVGVTVDEVRDILGCESFADYGPGDRCADRNLVLVYRGQHG